MTHILGLTGGIASGKSTVSQIFKKYNFKIVDADVGARKILDPGTKGLEEVVKIFGEQILLESGYLDRVKLGQIIFNDAKKRNQLDQCLVHHIREWIVSEKNKLIAQNESLIILDIPLLIEAHYENEVDEIMVVAVNEETQLKRLMKRNDFTLEEAKLRIASQIPLSEKIKMADIVIYNEGTIEETEAQVVKWLVSKGYYSE